MTEIYFDNSATTRISPEALRVFCEVSEEHYGNPSSRHSRGADAEHRMESARDAVRAALGTAGGEVVFTAGGTEANNLAILGRLRAKPRFRRGGKILTTAGEHASVSHPIDALAREGLTVAAIPTAGGVLDLDALRREATPDVCLVSMMLVNNESGALYDLAAAAKIVHAACPDAVFHVDATQAFLKVPFTVKSLGCDLVTVSSHKIRGPKGVGALWISPAVIKNRGIAPVTLGGGQEGDLRSGTENVPGIAAFAEAVRLGLAAREVNAAHLSDLRQYLIDRLKNTPALSEVRVNLPPVAAPHIVSLTMPRIKSETMLHFLSSKGIYVSSGSACSSHDQHLSSAMLAFGLTEREADTTVRVSFGVQNTRAEIDTFLSVLAEGVGGLIRTR